MLLYSIRTMVEGKVGKESTGLTQVKCQTTPTCMDCTALVTSDGLSVNHVASSHGNMFHVINI